MFICRYIFHSFLFYFREKVEPIGDGPVIDKKGEAIVRSSLGAEYRITLDDYQKRDVE